MLSVYIFTLRNFDWYGNVKCIDINVNVLYVVAFKVSLILNKIIFFLQIGASAAGVTELCTSFIQIYDNWNAWEVLVFNVSARVWQSSTEPRHVYYTTARSVPSPANKLTERRRSTYTDSYPRCCLQDTEVELARKCRSSSMVINLYLIYIFSTSRDLFMLDLELNSAWFYQAQTLAVVFVWIVLQPTFELIKIEPTHSIRVTQVQYF